jgi:hypothetical protein
MSAAPTRFSSELPEITRRDRARFVKEARRLRAAETDKLCRAVGHGLARLGRALVSPAAARRPTHCGIGTT